MMNSAGINIQSIQNKQYVSLETDRAEEIVKGLEQACVPFFAKYDETQIILTFEAQKKSQVEEILAKSDSSDGEEIIMFKSNPESLVYARELLPEISDILGVSVNYLENKPKDIQILLAQTYISFWHSDHETIKNALNREVRILELPPKEPDRSFTRNKEEAQRVIEMERLR